MSHWIITCPSGQLGRGRIRPYGLGTTYSSPSAARAAFDAYCGPEKLEIIPFGSTTAARSVGRPRTIKDGTKLSIRLSAVHRAKARVLGDGDETAGIRIALDRVGK